MTHPRMKIKTISRICNPAVLKFVEIREFYQILKSRKNSLSGHGVDSSGILLGLLIIQKLNVGEI